MTTHPIIENAMFIPAREIRVGMTLLQHGSYESCRVAHIEYHEDKSFTFRYQWDDGEFSTEKVYPHERDHPVIVLSTGIDWVNENVRERYRRGC